MAGLTSFNNRQQVQGTDMHLPYSSFGENHRLHQAQQSVAVVLVLVDGRDVAPV
ncbi:hypothetical protein [Adonisia turfae]|uniref:hypothetical protein n=1 Tax=Adonisia turfae TaxID=2950184 RepID=UPI0013CFAC02|nr:hypothetical protein [Adonisia turfae]